MFQALMDFIPHLMVSFFRLIVGLGLGFLLGGPIGLISGLHPRINRIMGPILYFAYTFPKVILIPFVILLFGLGDLAKIALVAFVTIFQAAFQISDHMMRIPESYMKLFFSLRASFVQKVCHLFLPYCYPAFFTCLKISLGSAFAMLFFAETYGTSTGVGYYIWDAFARFDYVQVGWGCLFFSLFNLGLFLLLSSKDFQKTNIS